MGTTVRTAVGMLAALAACTTPKGSSNLGDGGAALAPRAPAAQRSATEMAPPALDPASVVATVNGVPVTGKDLDDAIRDQMKHETDSYLEAVQKIREEGLDSLIVDRLLEQEAKAKGTTKEELLKTEIESKVTPPTDEQQHAFYDKYVKPRMDVSFDQVKPQIIEQLSHDKTAEVAKTYFDGLRAKYKVKVSLPVRRVDVPATGPSRGPADAKVTIVEFSDFQCPFCGRATPTMEKVMQKYDGKVRFVFREYPLPMHTKAAKAAEAALCANEQGKFWPMYDKMFSHQDDLEVSDLKAYAKDSGLDTAKFNSCLDSGRMQAAVQADVQAGQALGIDGTPAFFINGRPLSGAQPLEKFEEVIDSELASHS